MVAPSAARRRAARVSVLVVAGLVVIAPAAARAAASPSPAASATPSPSASAAGPSSVSVQVETTGPHVTDSSVTVVATLRPEAAWGAVALYDGRTEVASGTRYRSRWSYSTTEMAVGLHRLTVRFTPDPASGYAPSRATVDYLVDGVSPAAPAPVPHKSKDPRQPVVVTIPSVKATSTTRSSPTPTPTPTVKATQQAQGHQGPMPFTGLDAIRLLWIAAVLVGVGSVLAILARRRRHQAAH